MKKVLIVTHVSGFVPQFEMNNVRYLQNKGCQVHYAANFNAVSYGHDNDRLKGTGVICHHIPFVRSPFRAQNLSIYKKLKRLVDQEEFQLIHCHTPMGGVMARLAAKSARKKGTRVIYTAHGFHFFRGASWPNWLFYYPVERLLSRLTDVQITINEEDYERARHFHAGRVVRIPGVGVDTARLSSKTVEDRKQLRCSLGARPEDVVLLSVGECIPRKNHEIILQALQQLPKTRILYLICGQGELKERLESRAKELKVDGQVRFLGYREDVARIYEAADIFVFPSLQEGLSVALMEAMGKGLPAVASRIRGNTDLIQEGQGGFLVEPKDVGGFAAKIRDLIKSPDLRTQMGQYNRQAVKAFDQEKTNEIMAEEYDKELSRA